MQTNFFDIKLMLPGQINKELIFNEATVKIDGFMHGSIKGFIDQVPKSYEIGDKYIINQGQDKNSIYYVFTDSHNWQILPPSKGMCFFCQEIGDLIIFDGTNWCHKNGRQIDMDKFAQDSFLSIAGNFCVPERANYLCLYLEQHAVIDLSFAQSDRITMVIKQNVKITKLDWQGKILWINPDNTNHIDSNLLMYKIIEFYGMGANTFLAKIIANNYYQI